MRLANLALLAEHMLTPGTKQEKRIILVINIEKPDDWTIVTRDLVETFLAVYKHRNITGAAQAIFCTQSTVSHRVALLEDELGTPLFVRGRGHRNVTPTQAGEQFFGLAQQWIALFDASASIAEDTPRQSVTVGATDLINNFTFAPFYHSFLERHSQVRLRVRTHHSRELYDMVRACSADVGYAYERLNFPDVVVTPLYREEMYVLSSARSGFAEVLSAEELDAANEIYLQWSGNYATWHNRWWTPGDYYLHASTGTQAISFLDAPGRWAIVPWSLYESLGRHDEFKISRLEQMPPQRTCYRLTHRSATPRCPEAASDFMAEVDEYVSTLIDATEPMMKP